jgi:hypothetical protein
MLGPAAQIAVLGAVGVLVAAIAKFGRTRPARIDDAQHLRRVIHRDEPDFEPEAILVATDGEAALALPRAGDDFLLFFRLGARRVCWRLPMNRLRRPAAAATLDIATGEPTRPIVRLALPPDAMRALDRGSAA